MPSDKPTNETLEEALWAEAIEGVTPLKNRPPVRTKPRPGNQLRLKSDASHSTKDLLTEDDYEVLRTLEDLVQGRGTLDFQFSDEFVEGRAADCSRVFLQKLRQGEFAIQGHLDLHGMNREEAKESLNRFFSLSISKNHRCVLVICGRGLRSPGGTPVLKELLVRWLIHGRLSRGVLAFASAKQYDGGVGAMYVLLRKYWMEKK